MMYVPYNVRVNIIIGSWLSAILLLVGCALVMVSVVIWLVVAFHVGLQQSKNCIGVGSGGGASFKLGGHRPPPSNFPTAYV